MWRAGKRACELFGSEFLRGVVKRQHGADVSVFAFLFEWGEVDDVLSLRYVRYIQDEVFVLVLVRR